MKTIKVNASKTYDVKIGPGLLDKAGSAVRDVNDGQTAAVVTDSNVDTLYGSRLVKSLENSGYRAVKFVFPHGEASKNTQTFLSLVNFLAEERLNRTDVIIALGGGVPGDIAGFAAASYKRGTGFVQIPTTLLAAVDSSVGGKTAVNLTAGKNLFGAFYQPDLVICDTSLLLTLPSEFFKDGCAEVIKCGVIADREFFMSLKTPVSERLEDVISRCVEIKRDIVTQDEYEYGIRKLLNFGHTIGHAIELLSDFNIPHGHAVAAGMSVETAISYKAGICDDDCLRDIQDMLRFYELPEATCFDAYEIMQACLTDKKRDGGDLTMVLPVETGKCMLKKFSVSKLERVIQEGLEICV